MRISPPFLASLSILLAVLAAPVLADKWTVVQCPLIDRDVTSRVEPVGVINDFQSGLGPVHAIAGSQQAKATTTLDKKTLDQPSARTDYEFVEKDGIQYVEIGINHPLEKSDAGIGFYYRTDQDTHNAPRLRIRVIDKSGETHQFDVMQSPVVKNQSNNPAKTPKRFFAAVLVNSKGKPWGHWGGDKNGRLDYPCKLHSIVADKSYPNFVGKGSLWLEKIVKVKPLITSHSLKVEMRDPPFGNVYEPGQDIKLRVTAAFPKKKIASIGVQTIDFWGASIKPQESDTQVKNANHQMTLTFRPDKLGYYACNVWLKVNGKLADMRRLAFAVLPKPDARQKNRFVGFCCHYRGNNYTMTVMDLMRRYGFTEFRDEVSWGNFETKQGEYSMPDYGQKFLTHAAEIGMNPLLICDYGNRFYDGAGFPTSEKAVEAYAKHCAELVKKMTKTTGHRVESLEIWNEWSGGCGMHGQPKTNTPEAYAKLLAAASKAIKEVDPNIKIVGLGGEHSEHHFEQIRKMLAAGAAKSADAFSVHPYRYPSSPEKSGLYDEMMKVADLVEAHGGNRCLWITEIGWPTHLENRGVDITTQANYFVRTLALLHATGCVEKVHWYDFKDDGLTRTHNECNFGVVRHQKFNCQPKPAAVAGAIFARETAGGTCIGLQRRGPLWSVGYLMPDGSRKQLLWNIGSEITIGDAATLLGFDFKQAQVKDLMGNLKEDRKETLKLLEEKKVLTYPVADVLLDETPVYLEW